MLKKVVSLLYLIIIVIIHTGIPIIIIIRIIFILRDYSHRNNYHNFPMHAFVKVYIFS